MRTLSATAVVLIGLMTGSAFADSIDSLQINGSIGGNGGFHTVVVDGVQCRLKNSTQGAGQGAGCNYTLTGGIGGQGQGNIAVHTNNPGCSTACQ